MLQRKEYILVTANKVSLGHTVKIITKEKIPEQQ